MNDIIPVITFDGPSGVGKGTLAGAISRELGWHLLDSGALYRVAGWYADQAGKQPERADDVAAVARKLETLTISFESPDGVNTHVFCEGEDVTAAIRSEAGSQAASRWAAIPAIREALMAGQQAFRRAPGLIADGRDMGTTVFPDARLKFYVTASAAERASRRFAQMRERDELSTGDDDATLDRIYRKILARDARDANRATSPMKPAVDAQIIDTTGETVAASLQKVRGCMHRQGLI